MALLLERQRSLVHSPGTSEIDTESALGACLHTVLVPNGTASFDVLSKKIAPQPSGVTARTTRLGIGLGTTNTANFNVKPTDTYPIVIAVVGHTASLSAWYLCNGGGVSNGSYFTIAGGSKYQAIIARNFAAAKTITSTVTPVNGKPVGAILQIFSDTDYRFYIDGTSVTGSTSFGTGGTFVTYIQSLGSANDGATLLAGIGYGTALTDAQALEYSADPSKILGIVKRRKLWIPASVSSGTFLPVGISTETDSAQSLALRLGIVVSSETDTAVSRGYGFAVGVSAESDNAFALAARYAKSIGQAIEVDSALALSQAISGAVGEATETDTALALGYGASLVVGTAVETDSALARSAVQSRAVGIGSETDSALPLAALLSAAVGLASETDLAFSPGMASFPDPADVRAGVMYGPTGVEYTGTMVAGAASGTVFDVRTGRLVRIGNGVAMTL